MLASQQSEKPLSIFLHIPKTGGTTLYKEITSELLPSEALPVYFNKTAPRKFLIEYLDKYANKKKNTPKFVYGHSVYHGMQKRFGIKEANYSTILRNPATLYVSLYNHALMKLSKRQEINPTEHATENGLILPFREWVQKRTHMLNIQTKFIWQFWHREPLYKVTDKRLIEAKQALHQFAVVGITEQFDIAARKISRQLGIKKNIFGKHNVSPRYYNPTDINEVKELLLSQGAYYDLELYDYARQLNTD